MLKLKKLGFYKIIANVELEKQGAIIECPVSSPVFVKFRQELMLLTDLLIISPIKFRQEILFISSCT